MSLIKKLLVKRSKGSVKSDNDMANKKKRRYNSYPLSSLLCGCHNDRLQKRSTRKTTFENYNNNNNIAKPQLTEKHEQHQLDTENEDKERFLRFDRTTTKDGEKMANTDQHEDEGLSDTDYERKAQQSFKHRHSFQPYTTTPFRPTSMQTHGNDSYPKFLTANNIMTDRGCIVNIRTGSFNLGCGLPSESDPDKKREYDYSMAGHVRANNVPFVNVCGMNETADQFLTSKVRSQLSISNSPFLAVSDQQDTFRRCSHDPNIEKLHKSYINNIKLLDVPTPSGTSIKTLNNNASLSSIYKQSSSDSNEDLGFVSPRTLSNNYKAQTTSNSYTVSSRNLDLISDEDMRVCEWLSGVFENKTANNALMCNLNDSRRSDLLQGLMCHEAIDDISYIDDYPDNAYSDNLFDNSDNSKKTCGLVEGKYLESFDLDSTSDNKELDLDSVVPEKESKIDYTIDKFSIAKQSGIKSRTQWKSFRYRNLNFHAFQSNTWSKYQISAMSVNQMTALRKLALLRFSKLVESQRSSMIRTLRLFTRNRNFEGFKSSNDSISFENSSTMGKRFSPDTSPNVSALRVNRKTPTNLLDKELSTSVVVSNNSASYNWMEASECMTNSNRISIINAAYSSQPTCNIITSSIKANMSDLRMSNIVFGMPLSLIMQRTGQPLPQQIIETMKILRRLAPRTVGIFRKNGVKTRINHLKNSIDSNEDINFHLFYTSYDIADLLKLYLRELPECLITNRLSDILLANYEKLMPEDRKLILQQVMLLVPDENRMALQAVLLFLNDISKHAQTNQMDRNNLAVCFSPVLFHINIKKKYKKLLGSAKTRSIKTDWSVPSPIGNKEFHEVSDNEKKIDLTDNTCEQQKTNQAADGCSPKYPQHFNKIHTAKRTLNKAASTIASLRDTLRESSLFSEANIEVLNRVGRLCVSDMIKYSMDLFTVPVEIFEKLKMQLSYDSEPYDLEYFYDKANKKLKNEDLFESHLGVKSSSWTLLDTYLSDISIFYSKNEMSNITTSNSYSQQQTHEKLKLWKCCTLIKNQNLTLESIQQRIANERLLWDDDFKEGRLIEKLDDNTEVYKYVISFMAPHPSREFTELRHWSKVSPNILVFTSTSIGNSDRLIGDVRSNMFISKYIIEKLMSNDSSNTFKLTHVCNLDYKGFTNEFYNKSLGFILARLMCRLKVLLSLSD